MVYNFINYNEYLRYLIAELSEDISNKKGEDFWNCYFEKLNNLKLKTPVIYKHIIGLVFADTYRIYCYIKDFLVFTKEEEFNYEFILGIKDLEDLFNKIESKEISLQNMIENSIAFELKDTHEKSLCYTASDIDFIAKFNPFTYIENDNIFKEYPLISFTSQYRDLMDELEEIDIENKNDRVEIEAEIEGVVESLRCQLLIMAYNNHDGFKKMMLDMINVFYKVTKLEQMQSPNILEPIDYKIINLVENNSLEDIIDEIISDEDLIYLLIDDFLSITSGLYGIDELEAENCFEECVSDDVKKKLMEN